MYAHQNINWFLVADQEVKGVKNLTILPQGAVSNFPFHKAI
jgi:hypothetical protein